ncbi:RIB43A-like with coiled-coils protein 2 [Scleropages formosus]|uniref:RIB43A domain with coiled-coils 2 n=1 Tax=Scleropages formosus TaxID=113540 RepID=A0A8C9R6M9_SCLFO|nr:RIB43A-like with coiled-coils protein 2 [Scleropages formosus]
MNRTTLEVERAAAANIERRRNRELQRKDRIFNAKVRTIGLDKDALDYQVEERKNKERMEAEILQACAAGLVHNDRRACLLEQRQRKEQRHLESSIVQFRKDCQQPQSGRDFDLNDPDRLKKLDGKMMLPGLLGEDPQCSERHLKQQEQLREWFLQQQCEKKAAKQQQKQAEQEYDQNRITLDHRAVELQKIEEEHRRAVATATKNFNQAKASEMAEKREQDRLKEEEENYAEILNHLQGALLSESTAGVPNVPVCSYKGMSAEQLKHIRDCQQQQVEDKRRAQLEQHQQELQEDTMRMAAARTALLLERQQVRLNRQLRRTLDRTNTQLAEAQNAQRKYLEKEVYTSIPDDCYFTQFNTTSR